MADAQLRLAGLADAVGIVKQHPEMHLLIGYGSKIQYDDLDAVVEDLGPLLRGVQARSGDKPWLLLYGGDKAKPEAPDVGLLAQRIAGAYNCRVMAPRVADDAENPQPPEPFVSYYYVMAPEYEGDLRPLHAPQQQQPERGQQEQDQQQGQQHQQAQGQQEPQPSTLGEKRSRTHQSGESTDGAADDGDDGGGREPRRQRVERQAPSQQPPRPQVQPQPQPGGQLPQPQLDAQAQPGREQAPGRATTDPAPGRATTDPAPGRATTDPAPGRATTDPARAASATEAVLPEEACGGGQQLAPPQLAAAPVAAAAAEVTAAAAAASGPAGGGARGAQLWGGVIGGQPVGPNRFLLHDEFLGSDGRPRLLTSVIAAGGGAIALQELEYAASRGVPWTYVPCRGRHLAAGPGGGAGSEFGPVHEWAQRQPQLQAEQQQQQQRVTGELEEERQLREGQQER